MDWKSTSKYVGVVGAGQFGTVIANLLAEKGPVLLYSREPKQAHRIQTTRTHLSYPIHTNISVTTSLEEVASACEVIFPMIPAKNFRALMQTMAPLLRPSHILIHGIKGFGLRDETQAESKKSLSKAHIQTISQMIQEETTVMRIGCISGPNIAQEIAAKKPAATLIASRFQEVIEIGTKLLKNQHFLVYGSHDIIGTELCGVLKNVIAISAGLLEQLQLGNNSKAFLISRGIYDIVKIGRLLGGTAEVFLGLAGIGDVITSCYSPMGRNFRVGQGLAEGKSIQEITNSLQETAEGIRTTNIVVKLSKYYKVRCLVAEILHKIMHEEMSIEEASRLFTRLPFSYDSNKMSE